MSKNKDKKNVTIYIIESKEDNYADDDYDDDDPKDEDYIDEDFIDDEECDCNKDDIFNNYEDDTNVKEKITKSRKNTKKEAIVQKIEPKIPISKRFMINKGLPITDLASLITAFEHPKSNDFQKEFVKHLKELNNMIGMTKFKEQIINQILFFVQDMQEPQTFLHTVITRPPGVGKTTLINILAKIYSKLGILETDKVIVADRASLIGKWLGSTAIKTKQVLESAKGGILLLDEVYSLGNKETSDTFSKECIDTINQYLSEHVDDFVCIIAGYKDLVQECFFNYNPGLERRFPWRFTIDNYNHEELTKIMKIQIDSSDWKIDKNIDDKYISNLIKTNKNCFGGNGGDTKNLIDRCKISNARRVFTQIIDQDDIALGTSPTGDTKKRRKNAKNQEISLKNNKILTKEDIDNGFKSFIESKKTNKEEIETSCRMMYC
jgi:hypothetical protein